MGIEDCYNGMRPRVTTLKCNSQSGELLEITYKNLMNSVRLVETSCIFLDHFVKTREENRKKLIESIKRRHNIGERVDIKTSVAAINRFGKPNKIYFKESLPPPKATTIRLNTAVNTQRTINSLMSHYNKLVNAEHKKKNSDIFKHTEVQETYSNYGLIGTIKNEETSTDKMSCSTTRKGFKMKRINLVINKDKIIFRKTPRIKFGCK